LVSFGKETAMTRRDVRVVGHAGEEKRAYWFKRVSDWRGSGQTQKAFCAQRDLPLSTFQWWRAKLSGEFKAKTAVSFVPLSVDVGSGTRDCAIEVELRSRTRLRFEGEAALRALDRVVARIR
jgi:hypothetical protein